MSTDVDNCNNNYAMVAASTLHNMCRIAWSWASPPPLLFSTPTSSGAVPASSILCDKYCSPERMVQTSQIEINSNTNRNLGQSHDNICNHSCSSQSRCSKNSIPRQLGHQHQPHSSKKFKPEQKISRKSLQSDPSHHHVSYKPAINHKVTQLDNIESCMDTENLDDSDTEGYSSHASSTSYCEVSDTSLQGNVGGPQDTCVKNRIVSPKHGYPDHFLFETNNMMDETMSNSIPTEDTSIRHGDDSASDDESMIRRSNDCVHERWSSQDRSWSTSAHVPIQSIDPEQGGFMMDSRKDHCYDHISNRNLNSGQLWMLGSFKTGFVNSVASLTGDRRWLMLPRGRTLEEVQRVAKRWKISLEDAVELMEDVEIANHSPFTEESRERVLVENSI